MIKKMKQCKFSYKEAEFKLTKENIIDFIIEIGKEMESMTPYNFVFIPLPKDWINNDKSKRRKGKNNIKIK